jgi:hypothetical protein
MRTPLHVILAAALVASLFVSGGSARAQESGTDPAEPPEYAALIDGALAEFQASRWAQARALFERAHASFPNARTLRGIGMASYEMADYPAAIVALEAALGSAVRPLTDEQRTQVTTLLERARALVGWFTVPAAAADVRLSVDDVSTRPQGDWPSSPARLALSVGTHEIVLRDRDGRTARTRITVRGGEDTTLDIVPPGAGTEGGSNEGDPAPWIVSGVGAAVAIAGAILFGVGSSDIAAVNAAPAGTEWSSVAGVYDSAPILTGTGLAALIAGSAMVVVGVGWGLDRLLSSSGEARRTRVRLAPTGLVLEGWF